MRAITNVNCLIFILSTCGGHEVLQPRLVRNIKEYRERKDDLMKTVSEEIVTKMYKEWSRDSNHRFQSLTQEFCQQLTASIVEFAEIL